MLGELWGNYDVQKILKRLQILNLSSCIITSQELEGHQQKSIQIQLYLNSPISIRQDIISGNLHLYSMCQFSNKDTDTVPDVVLLPIFQEPGVKEQRPQFHGPPHFSFHSQIFLPTYRTSNTIIYTPQSTQLTLIYNSPCNHAMVTPWAQESTQQQHAWSVLRILRQKRNMLDLGGGFGPLGQGVPR